MKRFMISELMDEYVDQEVFPQGGESVDTGAVKARVLAKAAPAKKRRMPRWKTALIAAALAVGCALCIAAGLPAKVFQLASGGTASYQQVTEHYAVVTQRGEEPLKMEDGRLWLVVNGEQTDITDQIDENTPYIYDNADSETGRWDYLVVGGTPENYGWIEFHQLEGERFAVAQGGKVNTIYYIIDGVPRDYVNDLTDEQRSQVDRQMQEGLMDPGSVFYVWEPWYLNAVGPLAELGVHAPH